MSDALNSGSTKVLGSNGSTQAISKPNVDARLTELEEKVASINDRGLVVGTILRGVAGDMRHLTKAAGKVVTGGRAWRKPKEPSQEKVNIFQFVDANVKVSPENTNSGAINPETSTSPSVNPEPSTPENGLHKDD